MHKDQRTTHAIDDNWSISKLPSSLEDSFKLNALLSREDKSGIGMNNTTKQTYQLPTRIPTFGSSFELSRAVSSIIFLIA